MNETQRYRVRPAVQSDCNELARMRRALQATMEAENPHFWPMTEARKAALPEFFAGCVDDPNVGLWVVDDVVNDKATTVATITARIGKGRDVARFGIVDDAWVATEHRGRGLCRRLMVELVDFFRQRKIVDLQLGFIQGGAAGDMWQHFGFRPAVVIANAKLEGLNAEPLSDSPL